MLSIRWFKRCPDLHLLVEAAKVYGGAPLTPDGQSIASASFGSALSHGAPLNPAPC
jgi:hypothetical protein